MELFVSGIRKDIAWVIVERLTKSAYFIPSHDTWGYGHVSHIIVDFWDVNTITPDV